MLQDTCKGGCEGGSTCPDSFQHWQHSITLHGMNTAGCASARVDTVGCACALKALQQHDTWDAA